MRSSPIATGIVGISDSMGFRKAFIEAQDYGRATG